MKIRNTFIIFIVSGFWHGANWTFIVWGGLNAIYFLPLLLAKKNRQNMEIIASNSYLPGIKDLLKMLGTFALTLLAWVFFRAENIGHALEYISSMFDISLFEKPTVLPIMVIALISLFLLIEWLGRRYQYAIEKLLFSKSTFLRWSFYLFLGLIIFLFQGSGQEFIYFQF